MNLFEIQSIIVSIASNGTCLSMQFTPDSSVLQDHACRSSGDDVGLHGCLRQLFRSCSKRSVMHENEKFEQIYETDVACIEVPLSHAEVSVACLEVYVSKFRISRNSRSSVETADFEELRPISKIQCKKMFEIDSFRRSSFRKRTEDGAWPWVFTRRMSRFSQMLANKPYSFRTAFRSKFRMAVHALDSCKAGPKGLRE